MNTPNPDVSNRPTHRLDETEVRHEHADGPLPPPPTMRQSPPMRAHGALPDAHALRPSDGRVLAVLGEARRLGWWRVPPHLTVRAILADVRIDFRHAPIPEECVVDVRGYFAAVTLIVPPGVAVEFEATAVVGSAVNRAAGADADAADVPRIRVVGSVLVGEVKVVRREPDTPAG